MLMFTKVIIAYTILWIISEIILVISIKKSKKDDWIWLIVNILVPIISCIIYKLTHGTKKES